MLIGFVLVALSVAQEGVDPVITMERTDCLGTCPVYSIKVYLDGRVAFKGETNVAVSGTHAGLISQTDLNTLVADFLAIKYFSLQDSYTTKKQPDGTETIALDLPTTVTTFNFRGRTKKVVDYFGTPENVVALESEIDRIVDVHQWLHDKAHRLTDYEVVADDVASGFKAGLTPLFLAAGLGHVSDLKREIASGAAVNATDQTGWTPLMLAATMCHADSVKLLIESGANATAQDQNGDNALIGAASSRCNDHLEQSSVFKLLFQAGAGVNGQNLEGETALIWAVKSLNLKAVETLLKAGGDVKIVDKMGKTALSYAREAADKVTVYTSDVRPGTIYSLVSKAAARH